MVLIGAAVLIWPSSAVARERLLAIRRQAVEGQDGSGDGDGDARAAGARGSGHRGRRREWGIAIGCGIAAAVAVGGVPGIAVGAVVAGIVVAVLRRREPVEARRRRERVLADLPFAIEMLVACLRAGQPTLSAVEVVAGAVGGPLGEGLASVGRRLMLGADPREAWAALAAEPPLAPLARAMTRAALTGAPVAEVLARLAADARQETRALSMADARKVGVRAVAPLGVCFLPAFVCLGIVPVIAGLASQVLVP